MPQDDNDAASFKISTKDKEWAEDEQKALKRKERRKVTQGDLFGRMRHSYEAALGQSPKGQAGNNVTVIPETKLQKECAAQVSYILGHGRKEDVDILREFLSYQRGWIEKADKNDGGSEAGSGGTDTEAGGFGHTQGHDPQSGSHGRGKRSR